ncbi:MAG: zf-HC2 domain-containing protein [Ignavibacteriales bacterium]|nr:zf-HC2 domain-containing protein [Ignavibacteriales bacterium]
MKCSELAKYIVDYHLQKLADQENQVIKNHLAECRKCQMLAVEISRTLKYIQQEKPWQPYQQYWDNLLPRIRTRIEQKQKKSFAQQIFQTLVPVAASIVLVFFLLNIRVGKMDTDYLSMNLNSIPADELSEYYTSLAFNEGGEKLFLDSSSATVNDPEIVKELLIQDNKNYAAAYLDDTELLSSLSEAEDALIVSSLQK